MDNQVLAYCGIGAAALLILVLMRCAGHLGAIVKLLEKKGSEAPQVVYAPAPVQAPALQPSAPLASLPGEVSLVNVDDQTAAILMAIVAHEMNAPLESLCFVSIKEI